MLQRLLAERFHLMVHRDPREMDVYELVVGAGGHKMREVAPADELDKKFPVSTIAEQFGNADRVDTVQDTPEGPVRTVAGDDLGVTTVTGRTMYKLTMNMDRLSRRTQTLDATRMTMTELATVLTEVTGQPVLDKTDLRGTYQFGGIELPLNARVLREAREAFASRGGIEVPYVSESKAVEAIGLRLERRRAPIDVIVVDSIDRAPAEN